MTRSAEAAIHTSGRLLAGAVGPRGLALLRRVRAHGGPYRCERNADRDAVSRLVRVGYVVLDASDRELLHITAEGSAYLDRLMRAH